MIAPVQEQTPETQMAAAKETLTALRSDPDVQVNEKIRNEIKALSEESDPAKFREGLTTLVIDSNRLLPPNSEVFKGLEKAEKEMGFGTTIPEFAIVNIKGLQQHRSPVLNAPNNTIGAALNTLIDDAKKQDAEAFNQHLEDTITQMRNATDEYSRDKGRGGLPNVREDILSVLISIRHGKDDLNNLPIHKPNHTHENNHDKGINLGRGTTDPGLKGLPGIEYYKGEEVKTSMAPSMEELVAQSGVKPLEGVRLDDATSQILGVGSIPRKSGAIELG